MAEPGWYEDPASPSDAAGTWRWYDGDGWTGATATGTEAPAEPPTPPLGAAPYPGRTLRRSTPWVVLVVALTALGLLASGTGWRSERVTYVPPTGPGAARSAPVEPERPASACPVGSATYRNPHPGDGRTYGGRLALATSAVPFDQGPLGAQPVLDMLEDTQTWFVAWQTTNNRRQNGITLGEVRRSGFYTTPREAAQRSVACFAAMAPREGDVTGRTTVVDEAVMVDGRPAWRINVDFALNPAEQLGVTGERLIVVVVDDGRPDWLSVLAISVRLDRPDLVARAEAVPSQIRLVP